jgi:hypothetical protein
MRDATADVERERLEALEIEGERLKSAVAFALAMDVPLDVRCAGALASAQQLGGSQGIGSVSLRDGATAALTVFSYIGEAPSHGCGVDAMCERALSTLEVVVSTCTDATHGALRRAAFPTTG